MISIAFSYLNHKRERTSLHPKLDSVLDKWMEQEAWHPERFRGWLHLKANIQFLFKPNLLDIKVSTNSFQFLFERHI